MKILTINTGSSSLKFQLLKIDSDQTETPSTHRLAQGKIESIGKDARCHFTAVDKETVSEECFIDNHGRAIRKSLSWLKDEKFEFDAVAHRIVHGGDRFVRPVVIHQKVIEAIDALAELAPLHNPVGLEGILTCQEVLEKKISMVAVFDTAFHRTMPMVASTYAIPHELTSRYKIHRYGFHGIAHSYLTARYFKMTKAPKETNRLITLHLGHGCSAAAIHAGRSIDTSMGFTPLEGLVMGTRSGDLDPAIVAYLADKEKVEASQVVEWLNYQSGLAALSGKTSDMQELLKMESRDHRARLAIDVFCYRVKKYIGSYLALLSGADAVIFSGGIGENAPSIRARICQDMEWCGLILDSQRNLSADGKELRISTKGASCHVYVIPVDEESIMAREAYICLHREAKGGQEE